MIFIKKVALRLAAIALMLGSAYPFILAFSAETDFAETGYIICALILLIAGLVLWQFSDQKSYNAWNDTVKLITGTSGLTIEDVFEAFKDLDTVLGKPWLGNIQTIRGKCMIFGPNADGEYVYLQSRGKNSMHLAFSNFTSFIKPPEKEQWRLTPEPEQPIPEDVDSILRYRFASLFILPELVDRITRFKDTGSADLAPMDGQMPKDMYLFYEEFRWLGQDFFLYDTQQNKRMKIVSPMPCKTFTLSDMEDGTQVFKLTKKIFHIMPHYDLYERGIKIGRIKKKLVLHHDHFIGNTRYGKLELKKMNAMVGQNYQVTIDNKPIGTIARNLNINLVDMIFDNYVLTVNAPEYLPLMTAMAIMAARERRRDQMPVLDAVDLAR